MKEVYVVNCCRTAVGSFGGSLKDTPATELGAVVVKEALNRAGVKPEQVDEVMFGNVLTAAQGQNVARQVAVKADIPYSVTAYTVGMVCGSGMKSMILLNVSSLMEYFVQSPSLLASTTPASMRIFIW